MEMILSESIETKIYEIRGMKVMLDSDFSQRECKHKMFQLSDLELKDLRCQIGTTSLSMIRTNPYVFTEQGIYM